MRFCRLQGNYDFAAEIIGGGVAFYLDGDVEMELLREFLGFLNRPYFEFYRTGGDSRLCCENREEALRLLDALRQVMTASPEQIATAKARCDCGVDGYVMKQWNAYDSWSDEKRAQFEPDPLPDHEPTWRRQR